MTSTEAHYERLLFRLRSEKAAIQVRLEACEALVRSLADGSLPWTSADHAAQALVAAMDDKKAGGRALSDALLDVLEKDRSERRSEPRDNPVPCLHEPNIHWECGGCGLYLGSQPSPDFGTYPCVCGKKNRPRPVRENSHNAHRKEGRP